MGRINTGRVLMGGLLAGLVINVGEYLLNDVVFAQEMQEFTERFNVAPIGAGGTAVFVILGFIGGIVMVWLYAGIRPRFGAGPRTAALAGLATWVFAYLWPTIGFTVMGMWDVGPAIIGLAWGAVEFVLAALAGGALYQETAAGAPQM